MVTLKQAKASNALISTTLPAGMVAVFLGATSGIGEYAVKAFARYTISPRVYLIGRSQSAADRIISECQRLNKHGSFTFISEDMSLIKNVDRVCETIREREASVNLLFLTQGTLLQGVETSEGLQVAGALLIYARTRFVMNLLPLVQRASHLRRVINVAVGTKEGAIDASNLEQKNMPLMKARGHAASVLTLMLEKIAASAPDVSFVHQFPGWVRGNVVRDNKGLLFTVLKVVTPVLAPFFQVKDDDSGEWSLFIATSAIVPAAEGGVDGVPLADGLTVVPSVRGKVGGGVYSVDVDVTPAGDEVIKLLARLRSDGVDMIVWHHIQDTFKRITAL